MKNIFLMLAAATLMFCSCKENSNKVEAQPVAEEGAAVYMTSNISP